MSSEQRAAPPLREKSHAETISTFPPSQPIMPEASQSSDPGSDTAWRQDVMELSRILSHLEKGETIDMTSVPETLASLIDKHNANTASGSAVPPESQNVIPNVMRVVHICCYRQDGKDVFWPWVRRELQNAVEREGQGRSVALAAIFNKMVTTADRALLRQHAPDVLPVLKFALQVCANGRVLAILLNALVKLSEDARAIFLTEFEEFIQIMVTVAMDTERHAADTRNNMISTLGKYDF